MKKKIKNMFIMTFVSFLFMQNSYALEYKKEEFKLDYQRWQELSKKEKKNIFSQCLFL